jgi:hypothetical protein
MRIMQFCIVLILTIQEVNKMENKVTYNINKYSLATALSYLGYHYDKILDARGRQTFVFVKTPEFEIALKRLIELKKLYGNVWGNNIEYR